MINEQRLWQHIETLGQVGKNEDGSITRWPFTPEDKQAETLLVQWMQEAGMEVEVDYVGNVIGTYAGSDVSLLPIVCGSHFDSVRCGGMFDGCLGLLAGIEVVATMKQQHYQPLRTIKIIGFKDEEGNRFGCGMVGSKSIAGVLQEEDFQSVDEAGITLYDAMQQMGYQPECYKQCQFSIHAMYELHIEQASVLEQHQVGVGIVDGIAGLVRYTMTVKGKSNHAGATPMAYRNDPVVAMSHWIVEMTEWAKQHEPLVLTVGIIETAPGACNVICDHVTYSIDIRSLNPKQLQQVESVMQKCNTKLSEQYGVGFDMQKEDEIAPCPCDQERVKHIQQVCEKQNIAYRKVMSGAGHDSMNFKEVCPIVMLFVRSQNGYSHRKEEFTTLQDCTQGTQLLYTLLTEEAMK